jgi:hypothetical protein
VSQTNWDRELKRIEREFDSGAGDPFIRLEPSRKPAERQVSGPRRTSPSALAVWGRLLLVIALAIGMYYWPYARVCGFGLYAYMGAAILIGAGALWAATSSWQARMARAHGASMLLFILALALVAAQVLPRVGYANVDSSQPPAWSCRS